MTAHLPASSPTSDVLADARNPLNAIFHPRSIAVVGATEKEGSVGRTILWNLLSSPFGGTVYPVNPTRPAILGVKAYSSISAIPDPVDLAVIVTPAKTAPGLVEECGQAGIKGVIIISAGFKEVGAEGAELERQVLEQARKYGIRVVGPNCLGIMNPVGRLNATFAAGIANPGRVGFISQSGALLTAILDWAALENVGFSSIVSLGSMLDVGWGDIIEYLGDDPNTDSIVIYMETIGDARAFLSAAREVALTKPIIIIKPGRTVQAAKAAASHTGSLTGSDDVLDAAFRRAGVLRVDSISELFQISEILAKQPRPRGRKLSIVTNAGGPGVIATDALIGGGGELTDISPETMEALNAVLPAVWSHNNPIDIIGDAPPDRYAKALEVAAADPEADGLLVVLTPQAMTDPTATARALVKYASIEGKPVLASWMGGLDVEEGAKILREAGIPTFPYPDRACVLFNYLWKYDERLRSLYETPRLPVATDRGEFREEVDRIIEEVTAEGRTLLTEYEEELGLEVGHFKILPSIETAMGVINAVFTARASSRLIGLAFGAEDYTATMEINRTKGGEELFNARMNVLWAAKAAGIQALDSIFADVNDMDALRRETELIKKLGFTGKSLVNPRQIDVVHEVFAPKQAEVDYALQVMDAIKRAREMGTGVISLKGKMIDMPIVIRAARVLRTARAHGMVDIIINEEDIHGTE